MDIVKTQLGIAGVLGPFAKHGSLIGDQNIWLLFVIMSSPKHKFKTSHGFMKVASS